MITRKRARCDSVGISVMSSSPTEECKLGFQVKSETGSHGQTSPESDSNDWGLDELFGTDFNWVLDDDTLAPVAPIEMQGPSHIRGEKNAWSTEEISSQNGGQRQNLRGLVDRGLNKNALAARMNRLKKKEYVRSLEQRVGSLTSENRLLKLENGSLNNRVEELENETRYLRAVLANESMLGQLLSRLSGVNGMKFSTSLFQEAGDNDHDYAMPTKRVKVDKGAAGGVCLHVDKDHVSVEFCTKCAESASSSLKM